MTTHLYTLTRPIMVRVDDRMETVPAGTQVRVVTTRSYGNWVWTASLMWKGRVIEHRTVCSEDDDTPEWLLD